MLRPTCPCCGRLRDILGLTGTKFGWRHSAMRRLHRACGRRAGRSCLLAVGSIGERRDHDHRGRRRLRGGAKVQKAWLDLEVVQCGYCPIRADHVGDASAQLHPASEDSDIDAAMAGNICRCGPTCASARPIKHCCPSLTPHRGNSHARRRSIKGIERQVPALP